MNDTTRIDSPRRSGGTKPWLYALSATVTLLMVALHLWDSGIGDEPRSNVEKAGPERADTHRPAAQAPLPDGLRVALQAAIDADRYEIRSVDRSSGSHAAANQAQGLDLYFDRRGIQVRPKSPARPWRMCMQLSKIGRGGWTTGAEPAALCADENRIEYERSTGDGATFIEWFVNSPVGVEQGFTLPAPLCRTTGAGDPLVVELALDGDLRPELVRESGRVSFYSPDGARVLRYSELHAFDATGRELASEMRLVEGRIELVVEDADALYPVTIDPILTTENKIHATDGVASDVFGHSVAVDGDTVLVGAPGTDDGGSFSGSAYVFVRAGTTWTQQAELHADDASASAGFGTSVALSGNTALVGAPTARTPNPLGAAYVFVRSGSTWTQQAKLTMQASDVLYGSGIEEFGHSVALDGDLAVVGEPYGSTNSLSHEGSVYVFARAGGIWTREARLVPGGGERDQLGFSVAVAGDTILAGTQGNYARVFLRSGTTWSLQATLTPSDNALAGFGRAVALDGDSALVGNPSDASAGAVGGSAYVFTRSGASWTEQAKLTAVDAASGDAFGSTVALSGDTALIGAPRHDAAGTNAGAAYVLVRSGASWRTQAKLTASDGEALDQFGTAIALDGELALVGLERDSDLGAFSGSAYPFELETYVDKITAGDPAAADFFGFTVALSGDTALIGADGDDPAGSAYVFVRSGTTWSEQAKLIHSDPQPGDQFGISVDLDGDTALVGAWQDDGSGSAFVFIRSGTAWTEQSKLQANVPQVGEHFGISVALSGETALVGAQRNDHAGTYTGAAYVFVRSGTTWTQQVQLLAGDAAAGDRLGYAVDLDGDTALVGAFRRNGDAGAAYVFVRSGTSWSEQATLTASSPQSWDQFGIAVAVDGETAIVGAPGDDADAGAAYVFQRTSQTWSLEAVMTAASRASGAWFGQSVTVEGDTALVGSDGDDHAGTYAGAAYVFTRTASVWSQQVKLVARDAAAGDGFGFAVALSGDTALIGAYFDDDPHGGVNAGSAYAYYLTRVTPVGADVSVQPTDQTTGATTVSLKFDNVIASGTTTLKSSSSGAAPPSSFMLGDPPIYYEIETTATFSGSVEICIDYSGTAFVDESALKLLHQLPDGSWEELVTTSHDMTNDEICALTTSFSPFVISEPATATALLERLIAAVKALNVKKGIVNSLDAKLDAAAKALQDLKNANNAAAVQALGAFIQAVQAQAGKAISQSDADALVARANAILALLGS